jgi:hypothetical protein
MRPVGFTPDGKEVVGDRRGQKFVASIDEQGNETFEPYNEKVFPKLENLPASATDALAELDYSGEVLTALAESFNPEYVGPIAARAGKLSAYIGALTDEQRVEFYGNYAEYKNSIIKAITGAQMSEQEAHRIIQQIPNENASPQAFIAGVKRSYRMSQQRIRAKVRSLEKSGYASRDKREPAISEERLNQMFDQRLGKSAEAADSAIDRQLAAAQKELEALKAGK